MYDRITKVNGVGAVQAYRDTLGIQEAPDGLAFATKDQSAYYNAISMPDRLRQWLFNLRMLKQVPIAYFVPDAALLPPESIRFFNVDQTWMDRVIDGVFSAGSTGTVDMAFSAVLLALARESIDGDITALAKALAPGTSWTADQGLTGMLIRSELVRRWPDMIVTAYESAPDDSDAAKPVAVLRSEPISKDIYIALFAGSPQMVHVREPNVGVRFGVEEDKPGGTVWNVHRRKSDGTAILGGPLTVAPRDAAHRVLSLTSLTAIVGGSSRIVALHLERNPYVQEFKNSVDESAGFQTLGSLKKADGTWNSPKLRRGRQVNLDALQKNLAQRTPLTRSATLKEKP